MFRSSAAVALLTILPGLASGQSARSHTVVAGNTLWGLASQYLGDPFRWPQLHEANRDLVENPHRILPGWVVRIPDGSTIPMAIPVSIEPGPHGNVEPPPPPAPAAPAEPVPVEPSGPVPSEPTPPPIARVVEASAPQEVAPGRTVFYRGSRPTFLGTAATRPLLDVTPEQFYSAPWLIPPATVPERNGQVQAFQADPGALPPAIGHSARPFDRLHITVEGPLPTVGARLQVFHVDHEIRDVGLVVRPTGILVVESLGLDGVVAAVEAQFDRILLGDLVRPLPAFTPVTADAVIDASSGMETNVLGYAEDREVQLLGGYAFVDVGSDDGVRIGDEYVLIGGPTGAWPGQVEGRVKVVSVRQEVATARIVHLENPVFVTGVRLRPDRRVR
jgi:hypothetical protein